MQTIDDISYGVIPLHKDGGGWNVFLINQISRRGDMYWTFPKGHPEENETPTETALRELKEETGMSTTNLDTKKVYEQTYDFVHEETFVHKKSLYYLGFIENCVCTLQQEEVKDAGWFTFKEAEEKLTHAQAKVMLKEVERDITTQN